MREKAGKTYVLYCHIRRLGSAIFDEAVSRSERDPLGTPLGSIGRIRLLVEQM